MVKKMTRVEIQKALYKQKPVAFFGMIKNKIAYYYCELEERRIFFEIPVDDMGEASFGSKMEAKLLVRWIGDGNYEE